MSSARVTPSSAPTKPPAQPLTEGNGDSTPVRDEVDDVERCATPVMDEAGEEGGSTPVRDEW